MKVYFVLLLLFCVSCSVAPSNTSDSRFNNTRGNSGVGFYSEEGLRPKVYGSVAWETSFER